MSAQPDELDREITQQAVIISALAEIVPEEVDRDYPPEHQILTCILSARIGAEVLKHYGIKVRAIPVAIIISNEAMVKRMGREGRWPKSKSESMEWRSQDGSWMIAVGKTGLDRPGRFDGHVALLVHAGDHGEYGGVLVDLAIGQVQRPRVNIALGPVIATVSPDFLGGEPLMAEVNGCILRYEFFPEADGWPQTPDWRDPDRRRHIIERVLKRVDAKLKAYDG